MNTFFNILETINDYIDISDDFILKYITIPYVIIHSAFFIWYLFLR
jgi:hypothetical protein